MKEEIKGNGEKLSKEQKDKTTELYRAMTKGFDDKGIIKAFLDHKKIANEEPSDWKKRTGTEGALAYGSIKKYIKKLGMMKDLEVGDLFVDMPDSFQSDSITSFDKCLSRASAAIMAVENYCKSEIKEEDEDLFLMGTKWAAYFSFYFHEGTNKINEGLIGRAIVTITGKSNEKNAVKFENTQLDGVKDYVGEYKSYMDIHRGYVQLNLKSDSKNREIGRNIHIKVYCRSREQELLMGQYTTYERGFIQSGNILLQNLNGQEKLDTSAGAFSQYIDQENFNDVNIPRSFIKFLSVRSENYKNGVDPEIKTIKALEEDLHYKRQLDDRRFERFIERIKPKVFLASAGANKTALSIFSKIKERLVTEFNDKLYISYKEGKLGDEDLTKRMDSQGHLQPFRDIEKLRRTRFFILFLDQVDKLSYSYMQLGIAVTVSKVVIVVGKRSEMSNTLLAMRDSVIQKIIVDDLKADFDFSADYPLVLKLLIDILKEHLPKSLDGSIEL